MAERRVKYLRLTALRQDGNEVGALAQVFWSLAEGMGYNDAALKDHFNGGLDDPVPEEEMAQLEMLEFWEFVRYLQFRCTREVEDAHVFISSGENVRLSCNNVLPDRKSTTWIYTRFRNSSTVELIALGVKKKNTERHKRLSLGSDCSLNINNITKEDCGHYICQQYKNDKLQGSVYLHVLRVSSSSSSSQTEISAGRSLTLSCQLYSYSFAGVSCDDWNRSAGIELFWVNQAGVKLNISDSRYQILFSSDNCISSLTTTLLNEDHNREWRCEVTHRNQVKASVTYTVKRSG
ncbi:uncharacterized protein LOC113040850 [Carassius auratus]|uniref:Uncharacterized protein LOC113040850 n=1 Tax=Carassius auratus TaxID=7957 RepID=A0A6P6J3W2_CARAU|nr:uncharacterized protein LOC113040850 [Carassius auratus]